MYAASVRIKGMNLSKAISFGEFFKNRRKELGLGLREFCRKYGFQSANISRLERGLVSPPKKTEALEIYANVLNIPKGSEEWDMFFDLASAETESIPPDLKRQSGSPDELPELFQRIRRDLKRRTWTRAIDLENWAETLDARSRLPQLIRQLVHATIEAPEYVDFPAEEGVGRRGWDGVVRTASGNAFVPAGQSVWEIGVDKNVKGKVDDDFETRTKEPLGVEPKDTVYIAVTPRRWDGKNEWCKEKNQLGIWKEVRVYDSSNLEQWLETAPSVDAWFGRPEGVSDLYEHWSNLKLIIGKELKPEVFLATRTPQIESLKTGIIEKRSPVTIEAASPDELLDFISAYITSLDEPGRDEIRASQFLIVDGKEAWHRLSESKFPLVLIPGMDLVVDSELLAKTHRHGHTVILWAELTNIPTNGGNRLSRIPPFELETALESSGFMRNEAKQLAEDSGGSLKVLKRRIAKDSKINPPVWANEDNAVRLAPLILVGAWDDFKEGDKKVLEQLLKIEFANIESLVRRWSIGKDPLLLKVSNHNRLISRLDSWSLLSSRLTKSQLQCFEEIAYEVLSEDDPMYDLPADKRYMASVFGKVSKYSNALKKGLAETLVLLGAKSKDMESGLSPEGIARNIIRKLFDKSVDWKRWASLSGLLSLIAEASPEEFLDAVENDLNQPEPQILKMFVTEGDPMFTSSPHTGLLWALETLAWDGKYLTRVSLILARLAGIAPDVRMANTPLNSLRQIFLPWLPQTSVGVDDRIRILRRIAGEFEEVGWELLTGLLPQNRGFATFTPRPLWRDWSLNWSPGVSHLERINEEKACAAMLLDMAGSDALKWLKLIDILEQFYPQSRRRIVEGLKEFDVDSLSRESRNKIYDALREKISKHRRYSDSNWAFGKSEVDQIEEVEKYFEPQDYVSRYLWLFDPYPALPGQSIKVPWEDRQDAVYEKRRGVLEQILEKDGLEGVLRLAEAAKSPGDVGCTLACAKLVAKDEEIVPKLLDHENQNIVRLAISYSSRRFFDEKWNWVDGFELSGWSANSLANFALAISRDDRAWEFVEKHGEIVEEKYWAQVSIYLPTDRENIGYVVSMLLKYNRPFSAIDMLSNALYNKIDLSPQLVMDTLFEGIKMIGTTNETIESVLHEIRELFKFLQDKPESDNDLDVSRLAQLEWQYLAVLNGYNGKPTTLERYLCVDPKFFADMIGAIYRPEDEDSETTEPVSEEKKRIADNAYKLLYHWRTVPGTRKDETVDEGILLKWVNEARNFCKESGHIGICDDHLGQVLAHAPGEKTDGSWPCIPVRNVIEKIASGDLEDGFVVGIYNKRGTVTRGVYEGGRQERALSKEYAEYARKSEIEWPRTAAVLRRIADGYEVDAKREDERVASR